MNEEPQTNEPLLPGMTVPPPPEELRRATLARASRALESAPRPDRWSRIWESPTARLAWAASVLALAACHLLVSAGDAGPVRPSSGLAQDNWAEKQELDAITDLPRLSLEAPSMAAANRALEEVETDPEQENES